MTGPSEVPDWLAGEAERWLVRSRSGDFADHAALAHWQRASDAHRQAFEEAKSRWDAIRGVAVQMASVNRLTTAQDYVLRRRQLTRRAFVGAATGMAAAAAGVALVSPPFDLWPSLRELAADYRTGVGEQRRIALSHAASLELNTKTSVAVEQRNDQDRVNLIAGEIAVTTSGTPLVVLAGNGRVKCVAGTVSLRQDALRVTALCISGKTEVEYRDRVVLLTERQQVSYDERGLAEKTIADVGTADAWRRGMLVFDDTPLSEVVGEINRYRSGRIVLMDGKLGSLALNASFRLDLIDQAVPKIAEVFHLKVRNLPGGLVLLG